MNVTVARERRFSVLGLALLTTAVLAGLLAAPPLTLRLADNLWWELGLACMAGFALLGAVARPVRAFANSGAAQSAAIYAVACCWAAFWWLDLRHAAFQQVLWLVPACALLLLLPTGSVQCRATPPCRGRTPSH